MVLGVSAILDVFMTESLRSYVDQKVMKGKVEGPEARGPMALQPVISLRYESQTTIRSR